MRVHRLGARRKGEFGELWPWGVAFLRFMRYLGIISVLEEALTWNLAPNRCWLEAGRTGRTWRCPEAPGKGFVSTICFIHAIQGFLPEPDTQWVFSDVC